MADYVSAAELTISPVLKGVLALEELAGGVVSFTDAARIQRGLGAQNLVAAYFLSKKVENQDFMDFSVFGATLPELRGSFQPIYWLLC